MLEKNYDFSRIEKEMQEFWERNEVFKFDPASEKEIYSIDTPPATISGKLHIGHIYSYTQAEMIARFHRMQGKNVFYPFGFDDNGLPTERLVEREEGISAKDVTQSQFIKKCEVITQRYENEFKDLWKSLGFSCDWNLLYKTIEPSVRRVSQRSFIELYNANKAYMKESPVLWCTTCQTSIAQAELESMETETIFNYIKFDVVEDNGSVSQSVCVATTRPELLNGVVCLFVRPDDERYAALIGKQVRVPLYGFDVPILADEKVGRDKGTGVVMCATYGDVTDVEWCENHDLEYKRVITNAGTIDECVPFIGGMKVHTARIEIIRLLNEEGLIEKAEKITHIVAVHERCGKETEIIPSRQWYIDILSGKNLYLEAADKITWYPAHMKSRYITWVENLKWDWCISRQRFFGVPFPVWYCASCGAVHVADISELPVNPSESIPLDTHACQCGCKEFVPETAVLDTWATSSLTPQINAKYGSEDDMSQRLLPMSMRTQAHEIIRTWAFYTIVKSLFHTGNLPWKDIMICGFVLAKKGEKISKGKQNSQHEPDMLIQKHSADVIRYWSANSRLGTDTYFSEDELTLSRRFITKLWNASKFALSHLTDADPGYRPNKLLSVDRWIIERTKQTMREAANYLNEYEVGLARHSIDDLFWKDFCDNYLEIVKERLYRPDIHGEEERRSGQYALYHCLLDILKMYAIYIPHITEYIYREFYAGNRVEQSLHQTLWEIPQESDTEIIGFGEELKQAVFNMRKNKSQNNLSMRSETENFEINCSERFTCLFEHSKKDLMACANAKTVTITANL